MLLTAGTLRLETNLTISTYRRCTDTCKGIHTIRQDSLRSIDTQLKAALCVRSVRAVIARQRAYHYGLAVLCICICIRQRQRRHIIKNAHVHSNSRGRAVIQCHVQVAAEALRLFVFALSIVLTSAVRFRLLERHVAFRIHDQLTIHVAFRISHIHCLVRIQRHALGQFRHVHINGLTGKHVVVIAGHTPLHFRQVSAFYLHIHRISITHHVAVGVLHRELEGIGIFAAGSRKRVMEFTRLRIQCHRLAVHFKRPGLTIASKNTCDTFTAIHRKLNRRTCSVRSEVELHRTVDTFAICTRKLSHRQRRHIVLYYYRDHAATGGTISIRHGYRKLMGNGVVCRCIFFVLLSRTRKMIGIIQASGGGVEARYFQIAFISENSSSGKSAAFKHGHTADGDGGHAVWRINIHEAVRRKRVSIWIRAARKVGFLHSEHVTIRNHTGGRIIIRVVGVVYDRRIVNAARIARSNGHAIVNIHIISAGGRTIGFGIHITAGPADIEAAKTVETIKQVCVYIIMESVAITLITCVTGRTGSRHEIRLVHGREEVFTGNFSAIHRKGRHILAGIGRIKVFELKGTAILKGDDKIIAVTGQRSFIGGKFKNKTGFGSTDNILRSTRSRLGKSYVSHDNLLKSIKKRNKKGENS